MAPKVKPQQRTQKVYVFFRTPEKEKEKTRTAVVGYSLPKAKKKCYRNKKLPLTNETVGDTFVLVLLTRFDTKKTTELSHGFSKDFKGALLSSRQLAILLLCQFDSFPFFHSEFSSVKIRGCATMSGLR